MRLYSLILMLGLGVFTLGCAQVSETCAPGITCSVGSKEDVIWADMAWSEYASRGGRIERSGARVRIQYLGSTVYVLHDFIPAFPGGRFGVEFDRESRRIITYSPGY
jgi:hypothetical protein